MATIKSEHFGPATAERLAQGESEFVADRNIYLDADGNVVEEDNPAQVRQLVGIGGSLSPADVEKYGLGKKKKKVEAPEAEEAVEKVDGGKKASSPSANKKAAPSKNKGAKK